MPKVTVCSVHRYKYLFFKASLLFGSSYPYNVHILPETIIFSVCSWKLVLHLFKKPDYLNKKICRNLYRKICDVLFEIPSQIVQITSYFALQYRGNHSLQALDEIHSPSACIFTMQIYM